MTVGKKEEDIVEEAFLHPIESKPPGPDVKGTQEGTDPR